MRNTKSSSGGNKQASSSTSKGVAKVLTSNGVIKPPGVNPNLKVSHRPIVTVESYDPRLKD